MDVHLRAVQPTAVGGGVKATAELEAAVARGVPVGLELQSQFEVGELAFGQQPNVIVVFGPMESHRMEPSATVQKALP